MSITMRKMIDPNLPLRLIPRWNHNPRFRLTPRWTRLTQAAIFDETLPEGIVLFDLAIDTPLC
ncbi:hypothetical protein [Verminephrobacter eiseniae]|uniref:hypothetical protein n=1 Tax=Verminephrobacter eiseniae TaxID=364317 RepID=UPI0018DC1E31|nr:hypothetical protein [Verminephrobacter eiseniae]